MSNYLLTQQMDDFITATIRGYMASHNCEVCVNTTQRYIIDFDYYDCLDRHISITIGRNIVDETERECQCQLINTGWKTVVVYNYLELRVIIGTTDYGITTQEQAQYEVWDLVVFLHSVWHKALENEDLANVERGYEELCEYNEEEEE